MAAIGLTANQRIEDLYTDHHGWLKGWLNRRLGNTADAADLAQDAFVRLLARPVRLESRPEARVYLRAMANGMCIDLWRRREVEQAWLAALTVLEGTVEALANGTTRLVGAGLGLHIDSDGIGAMKPAPPDGDAWIRGILMADQMPLSELVAELSRYRSGHLGVSPEIAGLPVVGVFPLRDPEAALAMLERSLPVRVQRTLPWWTTLEPAG